MITLIQRVLRAEVHVAGELVGSIGAGLLVFVGVEPGDEEPDAVATARKILGLRVFAGRSPLDRSVQDVGGSCLVVSQFTLAGSLAKGNRPSFETAAEPARALPLYQRVADELASAGVPVATGRFAADMQVSLVNDGPVTFVLEVRGGRLVKRAADTAPATD